MPIQFRKKRADKKGIAKVVAEGGEYTTTSRRARSPKTGNRIKKGSTVTVKNTPGGLSVSRPAAQLSHQTRTATKQVLDEGSLQKRDKGEPKGGSKQSYILGADADKKNVVARKENPAKVKVRTDLQAKTKADIAAGKKVPTGALTYRTPDGKREEYAGTVKNVHTTTVTPETKIGPPKLNVTKPTREVTVKPPPKMPKLLTFKSRRVASDSQNKVRHTLLLNRRVKKTDEKGGTKKVSKPTEIFRFNTRTKTKKSPKK